MRILLLNRFFHPDVAPTSMLLSDLAFALKQHPLEVAAITSRLHYGGGDLDLPKRENIRGIEIHRVGSSGHRRSGLLGRSLDYGSFYLTAGWCLWRLARGGDVIVAKTDPPLLSVLVTIIAKLRGARTVNWVQDMFPEVAEALSVGGLPGRLAFKSMKPLRNWSLQAATMNVVVGRTMAAYLQKLGISPSRIRVVSNWCDGGLIAPLHSAENRLRQEWSLDDSFVVGYAGNLGRAHEVDALIEAMTLLQKKAACISSSNSNRKIVFVFVGGGFQHAKLEQEVSRRQLTNIQIHPYQPQERLSEMLGVADVHLVSLNPALEGLIVPSKFFSIAAAGRPTLFIGAPDGEIARLIHEAGCGFCISPGDGQALAFRILQLARDPEGCARMGNRARAAFEAHWDKRLAMEKWLDILKSAGQQE